MKQSSRREAQLPKSTAQREEQLKTEELPGAILRHRSRPALPMFAWCGAGPGLHANLLVNISSCQMQMVGYERAHAGPA